MDVALKTYLDLDAIDRSLVALREQIQERRQDVAEREQRLERAQQRLNQVVPVTLAIIFLLLYMHFRNLAETSIVMLSLPFALVGGFWFIWLLGYELSVAVAVGFIALAGVAAEFGVSESRIEALDMATQLAMAAGIDAIRDAGIEEHPDDAERIGVAIGSGIGGINTIEDTHSVLLKSGPRRVSPCFVPSSVINMISGNLSIRFGFKGPNIAIVTACTTATHNIGVAARIIQYGDADVMVAGGAEYATTPTAMDTLASSSARKAASSAVNRS